MKLIRLLIVFLFVILQANAQQKDTIDVYGQTVVLSRDTVLRNQLIQHDWSQFAGQTINNFLGDTLAAKNNSYWFSDEPPGVLNSFNLTFARGLYLIIYPDVDRSSGKFFSKTGSFTLDQVRDLKIRSIKVDADYFDSVIYNKYKKK